MPSAVELRLQRLHTILTAAFPGRLVERGRDGGIAPEECPAINIRRAEVQTSVIGLNTVMHTGTVEIDFLRADADHETLNDADHVTAHTALFADAVLAACLTSLVATDVESASGESPVGRLTARYEFALATPRNTLA